MLIENYLDDLKSILDKYSSSAMVVDTKVEFDIRPAQQAYVEGYVLFIDGVRRYELPMSVRKRVG